MFDIYKVQTNWDDKKLKNTWVSGGYKSFANAVEAIKILYEIDEEESSHRLLNVRVFDVKMCKHNTPCASPATTKVQLLDSYYGG